MSDCELKMSKFKAFSILLPWFDWFFLDNQLTRVFVVETYFALKYCSGHSEPSVFNTK